MNGIQVETSLAERLAVAVGPICVCDEAGRLLGIFQPDGYESYRDAALKACPADEQELAKRAARWEGRPWAEVVADWEDS